MRMNDERAHHFEIKLKHKGGSDVCAIETLLHRILLITKVSEYKSKLRMSQGI